MGYPGRQQELDKIMAGCSPRGNFHLMPPPALHKSPLAPFQLLFLCSSCHLQPPLGFAASPSKFRSHLQASPHLAVYSVNQPGVSQHCVGRKDAPHRVHLAQTAINMPGVHLQPLNAHPVCLMKLQRRDSRTRSLLYLCSSLPKTRREELSELTETCRSLQCFKK